MNGGLTMAENEKTVAVSKENKPEKKKDKKPSVFSKIAKFFREYKAEMNKVTWASREDTVKNFVVVGITVVIVGLVAGALDLLFNSGISALGNLI